MRPLRRAGAAVAIVIALGSAGIGCSGDDDTTEETPSPTTVSEPAETTTTSPSTTMALTYGQPCEAGSHPDCINPGGGDEYTYLEGGADCMAALAPSTELCSDLDGDGRAGYPDSG